MSKRITRLISTDNLFDIEDYNKITLRKETKYKEHLELFEINLDLLCVHRKEFIFVCKEEGDNEFIHVHEIKHFIPR